MLSLEDAALIISVGVALVAGVGKALVGGGAGTGVDPGEGDGMARGGGDPRSQLTKLPVVDPAFPRGPFGTPNVRL